LLVGLLLLIVVGLWSGVAQGRADPARIDGPIAHADAGRGDVALTLQIIDDVAKGQSYYAAVAAEYRRWHYPLRPAVAVRSPLLALAMAALPDDAARSLTLRVLLIAVMAAWSWRLHRLYGRPVIAGVGLLLLCLGLLPGFAAHAYTFHDIWAGALLALSLAVYDPRRWWWSVVLGFFAVAVRETAFPCLLAMGAAALFEGRRREALGWTAAMAAFLAVFAVHAHLLALQLKPDDQVSVSWLGLGGWPFVLLNAKWNALLMFAPPWLTAVLVPLMLLGLAAWPGPLGLRLALICAGYNLAFLVAGRPDNYYWGLIIAPLMALGLLAAPGGFFRLAACLRTPDALRADGRGR
jgi:hypothetical protein